MDINIHTAHFSADEKLITMINEKSQKLNRYDKIESIDVYLKLENNHRKIREKIVEIKINIPGQKLFCMNKSTSFEQAFNLAFDSMIQLINKNKEKISH